MSDLQNLKNGVFPGSTLAVVGHPVKHSQSPRMHNAALKRMALEDSRFSDWKYLRFEILPEELPEALEVFYEKGFQGLNLTLPHKIQALDLVCDVDPAAKLMGAVNTLVRTSEGFKGYNTDGYGLSKAVEEAFGKSMSEYTVVLLGAGGASRSIAMQCILEKVPHLYIGNRNQERLKALVNLLPKEDVPITPFDITKPMPEYPEDCLIINATSLGLKITDPSPISLEPFKGNCVVYDATYGVPVNGLIKACEAKHFPYADGLGMLIWQGARSLEYWSQSAVPVTAMKQAILGV
jgi:shikimate dehydrogenase